MTRGLAFWILMLIWLALGVAAHVLGGMIVWGVAVLPAVLFILLVLLGWQVFGPPLR